jgi:hypothetical protein
MNHSGILKNLPREHSATRNSLILRKMDSDQARILGLSAMSWAGPVNTTALRERSPGADELGRCRSTGKAKRASCTPPDVQLPKDFFQMGLHGLALMPVW